MGRFRQDIVTKLEKTSSTVVSLPAGSLLTVGGLQKNVSGILTLDTSVAGVGGMESPIVISTLYYIYAVLDASVVKLIATTSEIKPAAFDAHHKIGAMQVDASTNILYVYYFGDDIDTEWVIDVSTDNWTNTNLDGKTRRVGDTMEVQVKGFCSGTPVGGDLAITIPNTVRIDVSKLVATNQSGAALGTAQLMDGGSSNFQGTIAHSNGSNSTVKVFSDFNHNNVQVALPFTFVVGDEYTCEFFVPILGWSDNINWNLY